MGNSVPSIINANGELRFAGEIDNSDLCSYIKCSPNISKFTDYKYYYNNNYKKENNSILNNYILFCIIFMMFIYIFIWFIIINKMI